MGQCFKLGHGCGGGITELLAPLAAMVLRSEGRLVLTQTSLASIMDSIAARMDETREILRYIIGLLVFFRSARHLLGFADYR